MDIIDALSPVSLDDILGDAALQVRTDRKYLIELTQVHDVLAAVEGTRVLEIEGRRRFRYASTYFDTPELIAQAAAAHRRRRRFKVRTRTYLDSGESWLEVKTRGRRGVTVKDRLPYQGGELDHDARDHVRAVLTGAAVPGVEVADLRPVLHTRYRRSTLLLADGARATLDVGLTWRLPEGPGHEAGPVAVLETKTLPGTGRSRLDSELMERGFRPSRISKYATGMALLDPAVPHNRWHRTLAGPLAGGSRMPAHSKRLGSPAPTRTTSGAPPEKSTTVVGTSPHSPESITPSRT